jgi:maleylacetoacetate isomerase
MDERRAKMPAQMHELVLYTYWRSSSAYRVRIALAVKALPFRAVAVNLLHGEQSKAEHTERSPMGYVPCLLVDGKPYVESVAIIELLDEIHPSPPLYPKDPFARAHVRALVEIINAGTQPLQNLSVLKHFSSEPEARVAWAKHFVAKGFAAFEALMKMNEGEGVRGPFAYGSAITAADLFLVPMMYNAKRYGLDLAPYPRLTGAYEAALATAAVQSAIPENQPDAVVTKG